MVEGNKNVVNQISQHSAKTWQHSKSWSVELKRLLLGGAGATEPSDVAYWPIVGSYSALPAVSPTEREDLAWDWQKSHPSRNATITSPLLLCLNHIMRWQDNSLPALICFGPLTPTDNNARQLWQEFSVEGKRNRCRKVFLVLILLVCLMGSLKRRALHNRGSMDWEEANWWSQVSFPVKVTETKVHI